MVSPVAIGKACAKPTALPLPPVAFSRVQTAQRLKTLQAWKAGLFQPA